MTVEGQAARGSGRGDEKGQGSLPACCEREPLAHSFSMNQTEAAGDTVRHALKATRSVSRFPECASVCALLVEAHASSKLAGAAPWRHVPQLRMRSLL